jgi:Putative ATP-dependent DNA helicase recG C-terminal
MLSQVQQTYPQPIAYAYANIHRARSQAEKLDQILRCAEVTSRYLCALAIASFAAREDTTFSPPEALSKFQGNLAFGHFLSVVQAISNLKTRHPLQIQFSQCFQNKKSTAKGKLEILLEIRNQVGHDLSGLKETSATTIINNQNPLQILEETLQGILPLCELPLFLVDTQKPIRRVMHVVRLLLMGEQSEPMPEEVAISEAFLEDKKLYVGTADGALILYPILVWGLERDRAAQSIYLIDKINTKDLEYKSLATISQPTEMPIPDDFMRVLQGESVPIETITLHDGRSFLEAWQERQELIITGKTNVSRSVDWTEFDKQTLQWYSKILKARANFETLTARGINIDWNNSTDTIRQILLDGRGEITPEELHQLTLLFGNSQNLRRKIGRGILDLRARSTDEVRWDMREEITENLLQSLQKTITFITQHNPIEGLSTNNLQASTGSTDYIAVREALVNLFIHQDYNDQRTVAQIELEPHRTIMVNAGASLVSEKDLKNGGTSTARNPLIARALKLIGFAELAGSGLREVYRVWNQAKRRPPIVETDEQHNRFRIELDSRPLEIIIDAFWKQRLGVNVTPEAAKILGLLSNSAVGMSLAEICSGTGADSDDLIVMCQGLQKQMLIDCETEVYRLKSHLLDLAREASKGNENNV